MKLELSQMKSVNFDLQEENQQLKKMSAEMKIEKNL